MATRRAFLRGTAVGFAGASLPGVGGLGCASAPAVVPAAPVAGAPPSWEALRAMFRLRPDRVHLGGMLFASHPTPVRDAIERHRRALDEDPVGAIEAALVAGGPDDQSLRAAADYCGGEPHHIALTDSTTMGLGLVYGGLRLAAGDEILTTEHDHFATYESLAVAARRTGATVRKIRLYDDGARADAGVIVAAVAAGLAPATRVLAVTWVHSSTGVKLPIRAIADALAAANARRDPARRVLLVVDGVHGFGIEAERAADLGCDVFVAGCHKWLFGPRGTGVVWAKPDAWPHLDPSFAAFEQVPFEAFVMGKPMPPNPPPGPMFTPGGFHSFEHRWALPAAFALHAELGRARVAERIHALNTLAKAGLAAMPHVTVHTPAAPALSAGIVCFEVAGRSPHAVVERLAARRISATSSPYPVSYARITPALFNTPAEIDAALAAIRELA